ncbi:hypothetical protein LCGC14_0267730 [marine sediment metagenome]|uniref:Uncharacterized protein n=1 Tax=marine sediment metagenome TaxID=412755 RepID=A0A0F9UGV1_9ZZZZ
MFVSYYACLVLKLPQAVIASNPAIEELICVSGITHFFSASDKIFINVSPEIILWNSPGALVSPIISSMILFRSNISSDVS